MKLQVYRVDRQDGLFPVGMPKTLGQVTYLYGITIDYDDTKQMRQGVIVRKYDAGGTTLFLRGVIEPCSPSTMHKAESSTQEMSTH